MKLVINIKVSLILATTTSVLASRVCWLHYLENLPKFGGLDSLYRLSAWFEEAHLLCAWHLILRHLAQRDCPWMSILHQCFGCDCNLVEAWLLYPHYHTSRAAGILNLVYSLTSYWYMADESCVVSGGGCVLSAGSWITWTSPMSSILYLAGDRGKWIVYKTKQTAARFSLLLIGDCCTWRSTLMYIRHKWVVEIIK